MVNLGVARARRGIAHTLAAQGAFGRALGADGGSRAASNHRRGRRVRDVTNLDLSKPLPPRCSYASSQERAPVAASGIVLLVLLGLRRGRTLLVCGFGGNIAGKFMDPVNDLFAVRAPSGLHAVAGRRPGERRGLRRWECCAATGPPPPRCSSSSPACSS